MAFLQRLGTLSTGADIYELVQRMHKLSSSAFSLHTYSSDVTIHRNDKHHLREYLAKPESDDALTVVIVPLVEVCLTSSTGAAITLEVEPHIVDAITALSDEQKVKLADLRLEGIK